MRIASLIFLSPLLLATSVSAASDDENRSAARANFQQADADKDGQLKKSEFRNFIDANAEDKIGRASTIRRFGAYDRAFDRLDANKDGAVTPQELAALRKK